MSEGEKGCGEEGHVCSCASDPAPRPGSDLAMSLEGWIIHELGVTEERLQMQSRDMVNVTYGVVTAIHMCIMHVAITARHDEIAAAYKKAVLDVAQAAGSEDEGVQFLKYIGLGVFRKLSLEKAGKSSFADDKWNDYWMELNTVGGKFEAEMKRVWG